MKFEIWRTNDTHNRPCDNAYLEEVDGKPKWFIDVKSIKDLLALLDEDRGYNVRGIILNEHTIEIYDGKRE